MGIWTLLTILPLRLIRGSHFTAQLKTGVKTEKFIKVLSQGSERINKFVLMITELVKLTAHLDLTE